MKARLQPLPPREAVAALLARGGRLDPSFSYLDVWQEEHARAFTVAKSAGFDILGDIHGELLKALDEGRSFEEFARDLKPMLQRKGWWGRQMMTDPVTGEERAVQLGSTRRLRTIFDVNMRVSYAAGHWAMFERNKAARPFLRYVHVDPELHQPNSRPHHAALHNLVLPVDHPFWATFAPPNGWGCRCTLQQLSQRDIDRLLREGEELVFEPPTIAMRPWTNWRTGEILHVPDGVDPGWAYNPGKAQWSAAEAASRIGSGPAELAAALNDEPDLVAQLDAEFARWFDQAAAGGRVDRSIFTVGTLSDEVLAALHRRDIRPETGAITLQQRQVLHMLRDAKQVRGRVVPDEVLRHLPSVLTSPRAVLRDLRDGDLLYVFDAPSGRRGKIVVRLDFDIKHREAGGRRITVTTNSVRTAGIVDRADLANGAAYEILTGTL